VIRAALFLLAAACLSSLPLQAATPREVATQVADTIEREYFDAARGSAIADGLRQAAGRGEFDRHQAPLDLATALTSRLKAQDRHFNVRWTDPATRGGESGPPRALPDPATTGFGIRRVELLPGNVGYLDLRYFADFDWDDAGAPARKAIDAALQVLGSVDALLVDVRDNGGGSPAMVGYLSSAFVAPGADIYNTFRWREGGASEAPLETHPSPRLDLPLYILTSGRTGSAAEAFSYTLKNARRATVVGERTGGAANPGRPFGLDDGFSVFVSTGSPVSPVTGKNWEGEGVLPDVAVDASAALQAAHALALETLVARGAGTPAKWALEALRADAPDPDAATLAALSGEYGVVRIDANGDTLELRQARRPPLRLRPLGGDLFFVEGDPSRRVRFERDGATAVAVDMLFADGQQSRYQRGAAEAH